MERGECAVIGARRIKALEQFASRNPERALAVRLDVTNATGRESSVAAALERFGRIDVLANMGGAVHSALRRNSRRSSFGSRWK